MDEYKTLEVKRCMSIVLWNGATKTYKAFFSVKIIRK